jgi:hypothetical protein
VRGVEAVGRGTLLAGRYHVQQRVHLGTWSSVWQAVDETLERPVSLRVVDAGHPRGSDVVDAARRAAGVEDPRLQRILDVGVESGVTFVVSEWVAADSLTDLLRSGAPASDEVRRLVGETATALEAARHRGLHHLALTPDNVLRSHDGPVTVTGLAVDAALSGTEIRDPSLASRTDARALVALIYAGLTGRWPLDPMRGLEPPPRVGSGLPAPSELATGVPADLDALCRETLTTRFGGGPADPGEVATALAPWPAGPVVGPRRTSGSFPISLAPDHAPPTTVLPAVSPGTAASSVQAAVAAPRPPVPPAPPTRPPSTHLPPRAPTPDEPGPAGTAAGPVGRPGAFPTGPPVVTSTWPPLPVLRPTTGPSADPETQPNAAPGAEPETQPNAALGARPVAGPAAPPVAEPAAAARTVRDIAGRNTDPFGVPPAAEPPAPLLPPAPTARPPEAQTRAVLGVVLVFVLVLCLLAYCGLRSLGSGSGHPKATAPGSSPHSTTTGTSSGPSSSSSSPASVAGAPLKIVSATGFDPQGDGQEDNSLATKAYDSHSSSGWTSDTYRSKSWGGLKKGVGLRLDLGHEQTVHGATVTVGGSGASIELLAVNGSTLTGSTVLAKASNVSGTVTLTAANPTSSRYVVIWFTTPAPSGGGYRAEVDDVTLR